MAVSGTLVALWMTGRFRVCFPMELERTVDTILIIGILILLVAFLGFGGVVAALADIAWILLIVAVIIIAWRVITGRRPV